MNVKPDGPEGLDVAMAADGGEDADRWKSDPWLNAWVQVNRARYQRLMKELASAAAQSADPTIRARGVQIAEVELTMLVLMGKKKLGDLK